ncbi:MAG: DUF3343 domain-containing protein [Gemmatimonadetes bacterium]|nr:DUF3343 domain-containing protein [Gemmatimonadota bacterium]
MTGSEGGPVWFFFEGTDVVLWAEEVARERGIPAEVVPTPRGIKRRCKLSVCTEAARAQDFEEALRQEEIEYARYPR